MFCNQCEQTNKGVGCTTVGVCGKTAEVAVLQDLLLHQLKGISAIAVAGAAVGVSDDMADEFVNGALFRPSRTSTSTLRTSLASSDVARR